MSCSSSLSADRAQTPADRTFHTKACAPTPHYPRGPVFEGSHQGRYPLGRSTSPARFPDCDRPGVAALTLTQHPGQVQRANVSDCHALACDSRSTAGGWGSHSSAVPDLCEVPQPAAVTDNCLVHQASIAMQTKHCKVRSVRRTPSVLPPAPSKAGLHFRPDGQRESGLPVRPKCPDPAQLLRTNNPCQNKPQRSGPECLDA
jgi:hypothetical protein